MAEIIRMLSDEQIEKIKQEQIAKDNEGLHSAYGQREQIVNKRLESKKKQHKERSRPGK